MLQMYNYVMKYTNLEYMCQHEGFNSMTRFGCEIETTHFGEAVLYSLHSERGM